MKKLICLAIVLIIAISAFAQEKQKTQKRLIIISIDALRPEFYLDKRFDAPNLRKLIADGACAKAVESVFPSVTYPAHTTIVTGVSPAKHCIVANTQFNPTLQPSEWYKKADLIKVKTLWEVAKERSLVTASVYWPVTVGAKIDYLIPEVWVSGEEELINADELTRLSTNGLIDELKIEFEKQMQQKMVVAPKEIKEKADILIAFAGRFIIKKYKPNILLMHFLSCDTAQHATGRESADTKEAVSAVDKLIGTILDAIKECGIEKDTTVMIVGDHGFSDIDTEICPNVLLRDDGLIEIKDNEVTKWDAWASSTGSVAAVYLANKNDVQTKNKVMSLFEERAVYKGQKIYNIYDREQLAKFGSFPDAFIVLEAIAPYTMSSSAWGAFTRPSKEKGMHGYLPTRKDMFTGFIASGAGIKKGVVLDKMKLLDIAPTAYKLLGLKMQGLEGRVLKEVLK